MSLARLPQLARFEDAAPLPLTPACASCYTSSAPACRTDFQSVLRQPGRTGRAMRVVLNQHAAFGPRTGIGELPQAKFGIFAQAVTSFSLRTRRSLHSILLHSFLILYIAAGFSADLIAIPISRTTGVFEQIVAFDRSIDVSVIEGKFSKPLSFSQN